MVGDDLLKERRADILCSLEQQIRDCINGTWTQHILLNNAATWHQLCSSLDVIGDTELAFDAYGNIPQPDHLGATYILVYGVLQALVLQQDAVRYLAEALDLQLVQDPLLQEIREVRNSSVGHPTKRHGGTRFHFISRVTMCKAGFRLLTVRPNHGLPEFCFVAIPKLIATQRTQLLEVLNQVLEALLAREEEHKAMFKDSRLADAFPPTIDYYFEKLFESVFSNKSLQFGGLHVKLVSEAVDRFKAAAAERGYGSGTCDGVKYHIELVEYPLAELASYFADPNASRLNVQDANIFVHFVRDQVSKLRTIATEIDESYQQSNSDA